MAEKYLGESIPKLGFGLMRLPRKGSPNAAMGPFGGGEMDIEQIKQMVDYFMENGFTYYDTAYVYGGSEEAARAALIERYPRDSFTIATKLNINAMIGGGFMFGGPPADPPSVEDGKRKLEEQFAESLSRLGTDYIDFYMLHGLSGPAMENVYKYGALDFLKRLKAEGKIRHMGLSYHGTPEDLDKILGDHPEFEFVQLQINYLDWDGDVQSRGLYEAARKHNKPIVIMEPVKGGTLANEDAVFAKYFKSIEPESSAASWALRYCAGLDGILTILSGMSDMAQMVDNVKTFKNLKPFGDADKKAFAGAIEAIKAVPSIPCTGCNYCKDCPKSISIPRLIGIYNDYLVYGTFDRRMYGMVTGGFSFGPPPAPGTPAPPPPGKPSDCVSCGLCERECPQKIEISALMKKIAELAG